MEVKDCMKSSVISCSADLTVHQAAELMITNHIGTLPVINAESSLVGLVRLQDLVNFIMPDFIHMVENVDFVNDFGAIETKSVDPDLFNMKIGKMMGAPVSVDADSGLVRAIALLQEHRLSDLPVVDNNQRLVGIASYVDIGVMLLTSWLNTLA